MSRRPDTRHLTRVYLHLDRLTHNLRVLQELAGGRPLWPAIKANAYGHGMEIIARHLVGLGYDTFCVAHVSEAAALAAAGIQARMLLLSATLPGHSEAIIACGCEPAVCSLDMIEALSQAAQKAGKQATVHVMVDTGMGRMGVYPEQAPALLERCHALPSVHVRGLMSHFPCADEADKRVSVEGIRRFEGVIEAAAARGIEFRHMANSAALFDLPDARFDAVRPGIAIYGLPPSGEIANPRVGELKPVLEWKTRITFLKTVPAGTGLSYGHDFHTTRPSRIATVPVGYGDGLSRRLSGKLDMLVRGVRCPQVGRITMDQSLIDVTALGERVEPGDEVVIIGCQGREEVTADELAQRLGTINYEVVTAIARRVPRVVVDAE